MRALFLSLVACPVLQTGCASLLRKYERGSIGPVVNVISTDAPDKAKISLDGKPIDGPYELAYDGRKVSSPFFVYRISPPSRSDKITVALDNQTREVSKHGESWLWFFVSGLTILIDWPLGALDSYDDAAFVPGMH